MLTVAGNRGPMLVMTKGVQEVMIRLYFHFYVPSNLNFQANTERPEWSEEEQQARDEVLTDLGGAGGFSEAGLKKQIMVDRSAPVVNGELDMLLTVT